jgi:hypothetical protein
MNDIVGLSILGILCIFQSIERYVYQKDMTNKLNDAIKAVMSRNINEYIAATNIPKSIQDSKKENEEIDLSESDDETFDKALKRM